MNFLFCEVEGESLEYRRGNRMLLVRLCSGYGSETSM